MCALLRSAAVSLVDALGLCSSVRGMVYQRRAG
jgi:hypothetical protein